MPGRKLIQRNISHPSWAETKLPEARDFLRELGAATPVPKGNTKSVRVLGVGPAGLQGFRVYAASGFRGV